MVFSQVLAAVHAVIDVVGFPGNLLVLATIFMESRFHVMRYILLASLAGSDILFLILGNSPSIASTKNSNNGPSQHQQHDARRIKDRKAAVDVCIIIAAFVICYLPEWTDFVLRNYFEVEFPPEVTQTTRCIYYISSVTNPIIYSVRKREFRGAVKRTLRRIGGLCAISFASGTDNIIGVHDLRLTPTRIPCIAESRAAQVGQNKNSLNVPKGIEMNLQKCHPPKEEIVE